MLTEGVTYAQLMPHIEGMLKQGRKVTLPLRGYSMRPFLEHNRDKALLTAPPETLRRGDVILARLDDTRYALHRITEIEGDSITMLGDGNFTPEHVKREDVLAFAEGFYRKGRTSLTSVDSTWYAMYWRFWLTMRPVRRWLLLVWRIYNKVRKVINQ